MSSGRFSPRFLGTMTLYERFMPPTVMLSAFADTMPKTSRMRSRKFFFMMMVLCFHSIRWPCHLSTCWQKYNNSLRVPLLFVSILLLFLTRQWHQPFFETFVPFCFLYWENVVSLQRVSMETQHFICSFATRIRTSECERAISTTKRLAPKVQASHR